MDPAELAHRFHYHPPATEERRAAHESVREACQRLAEQIDALCPDGREKSLAITQVEQAMFWANAALARQQ
ncbi:Acb2/Tad1 domain-containing protein [Streptomyces sp. NPDC003860]